MPRRTTLLLTPVDGPLTPALAACLRRSGMFRYRLVGAGRGVDPEGPWDETAVLPAPGDSGYLDALRDLVVRIGADVVVPLGDDEALAVARGLKKIRSVGAQALVSPASVLERLADKFRTYTTLAAAGLAVPDYDAVMEASGLLAAVARQGFPERSVVVKPVKGWCGRGLYVLCGRDEPPHWLGTGPREQRLEPGAGPDGLPDEAWLAEVAGKGPMLVMSALTAPAYDADVLALGGGGYAVSVRRRVNPAGSPFEGVTVLADRSLADYCREVARVLRLDALHDIHVMTDRTGRPVVLEVNPRPSLGLAATLHAGLPMLDWAVARLLGSPFDAAEPDREVAITASDMGAGFQPGRMVE